MSAWLFEELFRARIHAELDRDLPDINSEQRVLDAVARNAGRRGFTSSTGGGLQSGLGGAVIAALVILIVGGALTLSLVLGRQVVTPRGVGPAGSGAPTPTAHSPRATPQPCDGDALAARIVDLSSGVGTSGGDIGLTNIGAVDCTIDGYVSLAALTNGQAVQVGVAHIQAGSVINGARSPVASAQSVALVPGYEAFVAFEVANATVGESACRDPGTLLITPPQGHRYAVLNNWPLRLCTHDGVARWIGVTPVSSTPYFGSRG